MKDKLGGTFKVLEDPIKDQFENTEGTDGVFLLTVILEVCK